MCQVNRLTGYLVVFVIALLWLNSAQSASLRGSEWKPVRIGEIAVPEAAPAFVQFRGNGRLQGHGGCNRLFAEYEADDGYLSIGPVATTRMACAEGVMAFEAALVTALGNARSYLRMRTRLVVYDSDGIPLLELRQTDWD